MIRPPPNSPLFPSPPLSRSLLRLRLRGRSRGVGGRLLGQQLLLRLRAGQQVLQLVHLPAGHGQRVVGGHAQDRKSTRLNSSHANISYAVFCLKKKKKYKRSVTRRTRNCNNACITYVIISKNITADIHSLHTIVNCSLHNKHMTHTLTATISAP